MRGAIAALILVVVLATGCSSDGSDEHSLTTSTAASEAATAVLTEAAGTPLPTSMPTTPPAVGRCPFDNLDFCDFANTISAALRAGDTETIVKHSRTRSVTCPGPTGVGPCATAVEGQFLEGYYFGAAHTDGGAYNSLEGYRQMLMKIAAVDNAANDAYGTGEWRLWAIIDQSPTTKTLVSTSIGPDPIYESTEPVRRAFTFSADLGPDGWALETLFTTVFIEQTLAGEDYAGDLIEGYVYWNGY